MTNKILFNRFEIESRIYSDDLFQYMEARDLEQDRSPVVVMQLKLPWLEDQGLINDLIEYFEPLQNLKLREVTRVLLIAKNKKDGFGVVLERPSGTVLSDIDELESIIPANEFIDGLCDAIHKLNVKGIIHGYLRKQDVWIDGDTVRVSGFGHCILLQHGWNGSVIDVAPEIKQRKKLDARADIYSVARLIMEVFPGSSNNSVLAKALERMPDQRFKKVREFQSELLRSWSTPSGTGIKPKRKRDSNTEDSTVKLQDSGREVKVEPVDETGASHEKRTNEHETRKQKEKLRPVNSARNGWGYFSKEEFYGVDYSKKNLFSEVSKVFFADEFDFPENTIDALNYALETPGFYSMWMESQGGVIALNKSIHALEKMTRHYRNKQFVLMEEKCQENIVRLNRRLLEITYPNLCPITKEVMKGHGWVKTLKIVSIFSLVMVGGLVAAKYYLDNRVFDNVMITVNAGEYRPSPYLKRYFGVMGGKLAVIDQSFSLQAGEVTVGEFKQYVNSLDKQTRERIGVLWKQDLSGSSYSNNRPVDYISRRDAAGYAQWISNRDGVEMRLPTYSQWAAAVITYAETNPVLASRKNSPMEELRTQPDHLIGNLREWSSETCGNNKYRLFGEDYMADMETLGELPCVKDTVKWKGAGFRLVKMNK